MILRPTPSLVIGISLVLLALVTATGAVSIGSTTLPIGNGQMSQSTWLIYSPWVIALSLALAGGGMAIIYLAARDAAELSRPTKLA